MNLKKIGGQSLKLIGVVIFVLILLKIDRDELFAQIASTNVWLLIISFISIFPIYYVMTLRWRLLMKHAGIDTSLHEAWRLHNIAMFLGSITPGRVGDLGRAYYVQKRGLPHWHALGIALIDRISDLTVIFFIAILSMLYLWPSNITLLIAVAALIGCIGCVIFRASLQKLCEEKLHHSIGTLLDQPWERIILYSIGSWFLYFLWTYLLSMSIGIDVPFVDLMAVICVTWLISVIPIAPTGLGTRDAALILMLGSYGVDDSVALSLGFLMFVSIVLSSVPGWWYWLSHRHPTDSEATSQDQPSS